uniref:Uncharacterized protein n=1 Tax=Glossina brevipalpis TaxID=37001 RepID=A0A1A9WKD9_9MUSC
MVYTIFCDTESGVDLLEQIGVNICSINAVKWEASIFASFILLAVNIYILFKWNKSIYHFELYGYEWATDNSHYYIDACKANACIIIFVVNSLVEENLLRFCYITN